MYAWTVPANIANDTQVDLALTKEQDKQKQQLAQWRKFNHLHGWMERLYRHKGGTGEDFNCDSVRLMEEDLANLSLAVVLGTNHPSGLPVATGPFFGNSVASPDDISETIQFILDARQAIKEDKAVFYDSWW